MSTHPSTQRSSPPSLGEFAPKALKNGRNGEAKTVNSNNGTARSSNGTPGLLLLDSSGAPIWFNPEAVNILAYPQQPAGIRRLDTFLAERVRACLVNPKAPDALPFLTEFRSGRRRYFCRVCQLASPTQTSTLNTMALVLERDSAGPKALTQALEQYGFTCREQQAVECLVQGLTSKEIASRMQISPNTVKAYLRLIMIKMGVSTRSGVVGKIGMARLTA